MNKTITILSTAILLFGLTACSTPAQPLSSPTSQPQSSPESSPATQAESSELEKAVQSVLVDKKPVSISFWTGTGAANFPYLEAMVADFQTEYPNITVDFSNQGPITELTGKLTQNIVSKTTPTLSNINATSFLEYIVSNAVVDLLPYYNDPAIGFTEDEKTGLYSSYIDATRSFGSDGTMYGFPTNKKTTDVLVYNKTFFDAQGWSAPKTWDEVVEYCKVIKEKTGMPGFSYDTSYADAAFKTLSQQWGSPYIMEDGTVDINNEATIQAMEFYKNNMELGYFTLPALMPSAGGNNSSNGFVMEECYMFVGAAAGVPYAIPKPDSGQKQFELGVAPIPQKDSTKQVAFFKGEDYCIFSNSTQEERVAAWLLVRFLSGDEQNVDWLVNTGNLPISSSMMDIPTYANFLNTQANGTPEYYRAAAVNAALEMQDFLTYERIIDKSATMASECGILWQSVMIGGADIKTALGNAATKIK